MSGKTTARTPQVLEAIRVIDVTTGPVGGMATMVLADFGADVIKSSLNHLSGTDYGLGFDLDLPARVKKCRDHHHRGGRKGCTE